MTGQTSNPESERREDRRLSALKSARIVGPDGTMIACRLRNISEGGARLELPGPQLLPHTFTLQVGDLPPRLCNLRWAKDNLVGVQFQD